MLANVIAAVQIVGGAALLFPRAARNGAALLGAAYLVLALLCVPRIVAKPLIYDSWGNFFEPFSLATGAAIVYARSSPRWAPDAVVRVGRVLIGVCSASFALEQAFNLGATASLVPAWIPPSPTFWAVATTIAFAFAALALIAGAFALLAARLLTLMIVLFGLVVWLPLLAANPHGKANWSETALTFAIAGAAWVLADALGSRAVSARPSADAAW